MDEPEEPQLDMPSGRLRDIFGLDIATGSFTTRTNVIIWTVLFPLIVIPTLYLREAHGGWWALVAFIPLGLAGRIAVVQIHRRTSEGLQRCGTE